MNTAQRWLAALLSTLVIVATSSYVFYAKLVFSRDRFSLVALMLAGLVVGALFARSYLEGMAASVGMGAVAAVEAASLHYLAWMSGVNVDMHGFSGAFSMTGPLLFVSVPLLILGSSVSFVAWKLLGKFG